MPKSDIFTKASFRSTGISLLSLAVEEKKSTIYNILLFRSNEYEEPVVLVFSHQSISEYGFFERWARR